MWQLNTLIRGFELGQCVRIVNVQLALHCIIILLGDLRSWSNALSRPVIIEAWG